MQSRHQEFVLQLDNTKIQVSSNFDSANLEYAQFSKGKIVLTPAYDPVNPQYSLRQSSKTFFHFKMSSEQAITVFIVIERMKILEYFVSVRQFSYRMSNSMSFIGCAWHASQRNLTTHSYLTLKQKCRQCEGFQLKTIMNCTSKYN